MGLDIYPSERQELLEEWRPVPLPKLSHTYEVSNLGRVRVAPSWNGSGRTAGHIMHTETRHRNRRHNNSMFVMVKMTEPDGRKRYACVSRLVVAAFMNNGKPLPRCCSVVHKNGIATDNRINNLEILEHKKELGKRYAGLGRRIPVMKITPEGIGVEVYKSARQAAKHNFISYQSVMDRCNGKIKNEFAYGYSFRWDDDDKLRELAKKRRLNYDQRKTEREFRRARMG